METIDVLIRRRLSYAAKRCRTVGIGASGRRTGTHVGALLLRLRAATNWNKEHTFENLERLTH